MDTLAIILVLAVGGAISTIQGNDLLFVFFFLLFSLVFVIFIPGQFHRRNERKEPKAVGKKMNKESRNIKYPL